MKRFKRSLLIIARIFLGFSKYKGKNRLKYFYSSMKWFIKENELFAYFEMMEINKNGRDVNQILGRKEEYRILEKVERKIATIKSIKGHDYKALIKDKFYSTSILQGNSIPCVGNIAFIERGTVYTSDKEISIDLFIKELKESVVIKNSVLEYNEGFYRVDIIKDCKLINKGKVKLNHFLEKIKQGNWIIQKIEKNSKEIREISSNTLNTTRIVTILTQQGPKYLTGFQSFATGDSLTDSWGKGAIYIGFDNKTGVLKRYGYQHPSVNREKVFEHPDSKMKFDSYIISDIKKAIDLCIQAHKIFYNTFIIGWDVILTAEGPKILEGNERPGMNAVQCVDRLLKKDLISYSKQFEVI